MRQHCVVWSFCRSVAEMRRDGSVVRSEEVRSNITGVADVHLEERRVLLDQGVQRDEGKFARRKCVTTSNKMQPRPSNDAARVLQESRPN